MKVKLTIADRFAILSILPMEGTFATLKLVRELREMLSLTEAEIKEYNVKQIGEQVTWMNGEKTVEMEFGDFTAGMIKDALKDLDGKKKLEDKHYNIYEQFVEA
jgi:hypothetical protein